MDFDSLSDYEFDLKLLYDLFKSMETYSPETETVDFQFDDGIIKVDFIQFTINKNLNSKIADELHLISYGIVTPFTGQKIISDIEKLKQTIGVDPANKDFFDINRRRLLETWKNHINPESRSNHISDFFESLELNLDYHLDEQVAILNELSYDDKINLQLNQNQLAAVLMIMIGKQAFAENTSFRPRSYGQLISVFERFKFKDTETGEYKELRRDILLKKISAIRKKDLNFDTIQSDLIAYLNEVIKA